MATEGDEPAFIDAITGTDRGAAVRALIRQVGEKLDAGMCTHCGGPRGEAAGFASLTLRLMKLYEALDSLPVAEEVSQRDDIAAKRAARRAAATYPLDAVRHGEQRRAGSGGAGRNGGANS